MTRGSRPDAKAGFELDAQPPADKSMISAAAATHRTDIFPSATFIIASHRIVPIMRRDISAMRILPMSEKTPGFGGRSIEDVQQNVFLRDLPACNGRWRYPRVGLNADPGTIVLFQYRARIIASAVFLRDEKFDRPTAGYSGALYFELQSIRTFDPLDLDAMRNVWPGFRAFGHVKQFLNPTLYPQFKRRLKHVASPRAIVGRGGAGRRT